MKGKQNFAIVNVNNNTMPIINEDSKTRYAWIPFGVYGHDDFFAAVTTAYNVSTTNAACVEGLADLIYGKGLYSKDQTKNTILQKLIPQEETKRVAFDLKLYGNGATWNSTIWQVASVIGPSISGFLVAIDYVTAYGVSLVFIFIALFSLLFIPKKETPTKVEGESI